MSHQIAHQIVSLIPPGALVFDIGAHAAAKSVPFLEKGVRVVMVEPQDVCLRYLRKAFAANSLVSIVPLAVGKEPGRLTLSTNTQVPSISTLAPKWKTGRFANYVWDSAIEVEVTTLDRLIAEFGAPDYIKIDVEGAELNVLQGLSAKVGYVSFEFTSEFFGDARMCLARLVSLGYREFNFSLAEHAVFATEWTDSALLETNILSLIGVDPLLWGDIYAR